jgi:hypothetical protein
MDIGAGFADLAQLSTFLPENRNIFISLISDLNKNTTTDNAE